MPPDGVVTVGTQVDITALQRGMAEAQLAVRAASADMSEAYKAFGAAARAGSQQAQDTLIQYQSALNGARAQVQAYAAAQREAQAAIREAAKAQEAAAAAAHAEAAALADASSETEAYTANTLKARQSAQLLGRELGVPLPRALSSVAAQSSLLGPLLEAALPVIAATAFVSIIGDLVTKVTDLYYAWDDVTQAEKRAQAEAAGLISAYAKETERAQELTYKVIGDAHGKVAELQARASDIKLTIRSDDTTAIDQARQKLDALQQRAKATEVDRGLINVGTKPTSDALAARAQIDNAQTALDTAILKQKDDQKELIDIQHQAGDAAQEAGEKAQRAAEAAARKNQELVASVQRSSAEVQKQAEQIAREQTLYWADLRTATDRVNDPEVMQQLQRSSKDQLETLRQITEQYRLQDEAKIRSASEQYRGTEQRTQTQVETGTMNPQQRIAILQQAAAQEYAIQLDAIKKKETLDAGYQDKYQQDLDEQSALTQTYYQRQAQLAAQAAESMAQKYRQFADQVDTQLNSVMNAWLTGSETMSRAWRNAADQMALWVINSLVKQLEHHVQTEMMTRALHTATITTNQAQDTSAAALSTAISAKSVLSQMNHYAALAAAKAWSALSGIPIIGPELGAVAAGAAYAGVMALAAFDKGTSYIPRDGIAMLHKGEAVLPPPQTQELQRALSGRGRQSGGDNHFHYSPQINAIDGPSVAGSLAKHYQTAQREQYRQLRLMNLVQ